MNMKYFKLFEDVTKVNSAQERIMYIAAQKALVEKKKDIIDFLIKRGFDLEKFKTELITFCESNLRYDSLKYITTEKEYKNIIDNVYSINNVFDVSDLEGIIELYNVEHLSVRNNKNITDISPLSKLKNLKTLNIDNCSVNDLSPLKNNKKLTRLYCRSNNIKDLEVVKYLPNLFTLEVDENPLPKNLKSILNLNDDIEMIKIFYMSDKDKMNIDTKEKIRLFRTNDFKKYITEEELYKLDPEFKLKNPTATPFYNLHNYFTKEDMNYLKSLDAVVKLNIFRKTEGSDFFEKHIPELITDEELYNLPIEFKIENYIPNKLLNKEMDHYYTKRQLEHLRKNFRPIDKVELFTPYMIKELGLLTKEEIYSIDAEYKMKFRYRLNSYNNRKSGIDLHNYITSEEAASYSIDDKIEYEYVLTDDDINNLKDYQIYNYKYNGVDITDEKDDERLDFIESVIETDFKNKIEFVSNTEIDIDEIFKKDDFDSDYGSVNIDDNYIEVVMDEDDFITYILDENYDDNGHIIRHLLYNNNDYNILDPYSELEYIDNYFDNETEIMVKSLMDIFNFKRKNDESIENGEVVEFFEKYKEALYYDYESPGHNRKEKIDLEDFIYDVSYVMENHIESSFNLIKPYIKYEYSNGVLSFDIKEIYHIIKDKDFFDLDSMLNIFPSFSDCVKLYNEDARKENEKSNKKEEKRIVDYPTDFNEYSHNIDISEPNENFRKKLEKVLERISDDETYNFKIGNSDDISNHINNNSKKINSIVSKLGFVDDRLEKNDIKIQIKEIDPIQDRIKIERIFNNKNETGWVKSDNLYTYIQKNLFENKKMKNLKYFNFYK